MNRLPEFARWLLFLPAVALSMIAIGLINVLVIGSGSMWREFLAAAAVAWFAFPAVFGFAPRGKRIAGWVFYVLVVVMFIGMMQVLAIVRGVTEGWAHEDWLDLARAAAWLIVGTFSFRRCLAQEDAASTAAEEKPVALQHVESAPSIWRGRLRDD